MKPGKVIQTIDQIGEALNIIWTIAAKDIVDALKNKVIVSMIIMLSVVLLVPKLLPLIFEPPEMVLPVYDAGSSHRLPMILSDAGISIQELRSEEEWSSVLCSRMVPAIGLRIEADFDRFLSSADPLEIQGVICWGDRHRVADIKHQLEASLAQALGQPVMISTENSLVYPGGEGVIFLSLALVNSVLMILMMGIFLVPSLLFEEKESKTLQALLVSPASISQVVIGKALAGFFYILVTAVIIFTISWAEVVHWGLAVLFAVGGGFFSVAVGLVIGSFFEKQQDGIGWLTALLLFLVGAVLVNMLGMDLPQLVDQILPWVPSVALADICRAAYSQSVPLNRVLADLGIILAVSLPLYALVVWKVRCSDR